MKKQGFEGILKGVFCAMLTLCIAGAIAPIKASALPCTPGPPDGTVKAWGTMTRTYTVGEAFRSREVGLNYYQNGGTQWYGDHLELWANGVPIYDGYKFQEVGQKVITVKRYDKQDTYELQVVPVLNGRLGECSIVTTMGKTTYQQSTEDFDPRDIVVKCVFTDGTTQNLGYKDLELYAGARGMANYKWGTAVKAHYRFREAGEKDLIVRVLNKEMRIPFTVTPFSTKAADKVLLAAEPTDSYMVGEAFRADEYTLRCCYTDGMTEDFSGTRLDITANGTRIYDGYRFKEAGTKDVLIRLGDKSVKATLTVRK